MKSIRQLLRQPLRTGSGILLVALAVAILVTCVGQYAAGRLTRVNVDDNYDTIALLSDKYFWESRPEGRVHYSILPEEYQNWIDDTILQRSDLIKQESYSEVYSAYAPGISPDNFSKYDNGDLMDFYRPHSCIGNPYRCAVLEVTLTKLGTVFDEDTVNYATPEDPVGQDFRKYINVLCAGTVERVIGLEQGFASSVGKTIVIMVRAFDEDALAALSLEEGQRYLVYGMDYTDVDGEAKYSKVITYPTLFENLFGAAPIGLNGPEYDPILEQFDCYMTVCDYSALPIMYSSAGKFELRNDLRETSYLDADGMHMTYTATEEFIPNYTVPTIDKLDGTAEELLESENGNLWRQVLEEMEISNHGFPVLAVDKLGYQVVFARQKARIVDGRDFTEKERTDGSKVCIISQELASENGLQVGDTIEMRSYGIDPNIEVQHSDLLSGTRFPSAAVYSRAMGFTSEPETYTIVGLYRQKDAWQNREDAYGITPNVIFVPKDSISGDKLTRDSGIYYTLVLHNGMMEAFQTLQKEAGYPDMFICYDQGYMDIVNSLDAYEGISRQVFFIGMAAYAAVMLLFILLFPLRQRATLATMGSLGASRARKITHLLFSSIGILIPGAIAGAVIGILAWEKVAAELMASVNVSIPLEADMLVTGPVVATVQLAVAVFAVLVLSVLITGSKNMMKRK